MTFVPAGRISRRFLAAVGLTTAAFAALLVLGSWSVSQRQMYRLLHQQAALALAFDLAIRDYVSTRIRPAVVELSPPGTFTPATMSSSFAARSIFEQVREAFPEYLIKFSSDHPRNPDNLAGPDELRILDYFASHPEASIWKGEITLDGLRYLAHFKARRVEESCLVCHGQPESAPDRLVELYGAEAGFHRRLGEVMAMDMVAVPLYRARQELLGQVARQAGFLALGLASLFGAIALFYRRTVCRRLHSIADDLQAAMVRPDALNRDPRPGRGVDELGLLACSVQDISRRLRVSEDVVAERVGERTGALQAEIEERRLAEVSLREAGTRLRCQNEALSALVGSDAGGAEPVESLFRRYTETAARTIAVSRAGIWLFDGDQEAIRCRDLFDAGSGVHTAGQVLRAAKYPDYFAALASRRTVAAHDAARHPDTCAFREEYLEPLGIQAMLHASIRMGGRVVGVVCFEHAGTPRIWSDDEQTFAGSVADLVALALHAEERRRSAEQLGRASEDQRRILDSAVTAFFTVDAERRVVSVNRAFSEITGYAEGEILGRPCAAFAAESCQATCRADCAGDGPRKQHCTLLARDGRLLDVLKSAQPVFGLGGRFLGAVESFVDVSELVDARRQAESASRAKGEFLANVSHEIRTPLNGVLGAIDLVLASEVEQAQRTLLEMALGSATSLLGIINDILDFSKIEAGRLELDPQPFDLREMLEASLAALKLRAEAQGLALARDVAPEVPDHLVGDAGRLRQVLVNLVGNAVKFTERGEVAVRVALIDATGEQARLRFEIRDTGIGIAPDKTQLIFEAFTQADGSVTRRFGGTGLGLPFSARLVELMGGAISVESEPGRGSVFSFDVLLGLATGRNLAAA